MNKLIILSLVFVISGCAISRHVSSVDSTVSIEKIYVQNNEKVHMKGLVKEIVTQVNELGFDSESYSGDRPASALHYIIYTGNWNWDLAMYLTYFRATLYEDGRVLGEVEYDAKMGGGNMGKFGKTASKIKPLLTELLSKVKRPSE
ncbi:MAG: hypothetical protein ACJAUP_003775 [Cellvibrionaceae bacterium]|jgi:hypothetical protein